METYTATADKALTDGVVIDLTGGCEYCKANKLIINHGLIEQVFACVVGDKLVVEWADVVDKYAQGYSSCAERINYCPMCGAKLSKRAWA